MEDEMTLDLSKVIELFKKSKLLINGGKNFNEINRKNLKLEHRIFILIQTIITIIFLILSLTTKNLILYLVSLSIMPTNIIGYHQLFYQATGQFDKYAKTSCLSTILNLTLTLILVFIFKSNNYILYCFTTLISNLILFIILEIKFHKDFHYKKYVYDKKVWNNIKVGFFILLGNLSVMMFYAIDRWFIKIFFTNNDFAYYSFAVSMLNIINTLISAISVTFYNYISEKEDKEMLKKIEKYFFILGAIAALGYFVLAGIINVYLKKYIPSLEIIAISFSAYPFMIVINTLYVNLYKARKDERKYLKVVILMLVIAIGYNILFMFIFKKPTAIALATTASFITWFIYSLKDFKYLMPKIKEIIYLVIIFISFLLTSHINIWYIGGLIYFIITVVMIFMVFKEYVFNIIEYFKQKLKLIHL